MADQLTLDTTIGDVPEAHPLVGVRFDSDHGPLQVTGPAPWSGEYILCESLDGAFKTARRAEYFRGHT